jgi:mannose-6-phosphate isomerase-like protein (cupin superfamily)
MAIIPGTEIRRVVTTHDASGKAVVLIDAITPHTATRPDSGTTGRKIWATESVPAEMTGTKDRATLPGGIAPPEGGTVFRVVDFPPEPDTVKNLPPDHLSKMIGHDHHAPAKVRPPRHSQMHRTRTIDYAIVLAGEIDMLLDDTEVHLKAGDVLVQQATNHAWVNRGKETCRIAFILIDGVEPVT